MPHSRSDQRWNSLDGVTNRKVGRAPDEIDRGKGKRQLDGVRAVGAGRWLVWVGHEHGPASYVYHLFAGQPFIRQPAAADRGHGLGRLMVRHDRGFHLTY